MGSSSSFSRALLPRKVGLGDRRLDEPDGTLSSDSDDEDGMAPIGREIGAMGLCTAPKAGSNGPPRPMGSCREERRIWLPIPFTAGSDSEREEKPAATGEGKLEPDPIVPGVPKVFGGPIGGNPGGGPFENGELPSKPVSIGVGYPRGRADGPNPAPCACWNPEAYGI